MWPLPSTGRVPGYAPGRARISTFFEKSKFVSVILLFLVTWSHIIRHGNCSVLPGVVERVCDVATAAPDVVQRSNRPSQWFLSVIYDSTAYATTMHIPCRLPIGPRLWGLTSTNHSIAGHKI